MKKLPFSVLLTLFILLLPTKNYAQCKFDKNEKDPFSGEMVRTYYTGIGKMGWNWKLGLEQKGDKCMLGLTIKWSGKHEDVMEKGRKIMLKLKTGK